MKISRISRFLMASVTAYMFFIIQVNAKEVAGVTVDEQLTLGEKTLVLNGAGVRSKFFMDLYVGALYLANQSSDASEIVAADAEMAIRLNITSGMITSERMIEAIEEGFDNATKGKPDAIRSQIDAFIKVFNEEIKVNDVFTITYMGNEQLIVRKNGSVIAEMTANMMFKKALWGIWLAEKPAQKSLKKAMLGL